MSEPKKREDFPWNLIRGRQKHLKVCVKCCVEQGEVLRDSVSCLVPEECPQHELGKIECEMCGWTMPIVFLFKPPPAPVVSPYHAKPPTKAEAPR